jgi:hypothetical protein
MSEPIPTTLYKRAAWSRLMVFEFEKFAELVAGQTLSAPTVTVTPSGPTIGSPAVSGSQIQVRVSGGTAGVTYSLLCTATTSGSSTIDQTGILIVF